MPDDDGKALRVIGFFLLLLGSGVILDTNAEAVGTGVAVCGVALFVWGFIAARRRTEAPAVAAKGPERC